MHIYELFFFAIALCFFYYVLISDEFSDVEKFRIVPGILSKIEGDLKLTVNIWNNIDNLKLGWIHNHAHCI